MELFFEQIVELIRRDPVRPVWVVVPSSALGHTLGERLARDGVAWGNLRFTTVWELAERVAGPILAKRGILPLEAGLGPALVLQLLLDVPDSVPKYFRKIAEQPGVGDALWRSLSELRLAGLTARELVPNAFSTPDKYAECTALLAAYEAYLAEESLADAADVLRAALQAPRKFPVTSASCLLEMPNAAIAALEREFLDSLPAQKIAARMPLIAGVEARQPSGEPVQITRVICSDSERLAWIAKPHVASAPLHDGKLQLFRAAGREAEVEEVLRRILQLRVPFDSVEVICARPGEYAPLFWEKAARLDIALTIETGISGLLTRPVRAALAFCGWIESNFAAVRLSRMFDAGLIAPPDDLNLSATSAAGLLRRAGVTTGRSSYVNALTALATSSEQRSRDPELNEDQRKSYERRAERARALARWLGDLLESVPASSTTGVRLADMMAAVRQLLDDAARIAGPEDVAARESAIVSLSALEPLGELIRPVGFTLALIRERLESVTVAAARPRPGAVHLSPLTGPGYSGRRVTFVVGLDEGSVFPAGLEDPVLLDEERQRIGAGRLRSSSDRVSDSVQSALTRIATLSGQVTLSYSSRDLRNGRETYPSWIIFHACQLMRPGSSLKHADVIAILGDPVTLVPGSRDDASSGLGWWLSSLRGLGALAMPAIRRAFRGIDQGLAAEEARGSESFTPYDGFVPAAGADLDPRAASVVYSATRLENFARCGFRFFLENGLGLDPEPDSEPDPDTWLDPLTRGGFLHDVYRDFLRAIRKKGRRPTDKDWDLLWKIANRGLNDLRDALPPPSDSIYENEKHQVERDLRLFLGLEIEHGGEPVAIEVPFGLTETDSEEPLSRRKPIEIPLGDKQTVRLRGRIDRIDRLKPGVFEVIDYKTGTLYRKKYNGSFAGGTVLQHALYAEAARRMLADGGVKVKELSSTYYFSTERAWGARIRKNPTDVKPVMQDLADALSAGAFLRGGENAGCFYCDYVRACPSSEVDQAAAKITDSNPGIQALVQLRKHE